MELPRQMSMASEKESVKRKEQAIIIKRFQEKVGIPRNQPYLHERMKKQFEENEIRQNKKSN